MSPYVVPDHVLERNIPTPLTPTFWGDLTIVSFDALDYPQTSAFPDNHVPAQLPASSKESENTSTPLAKWADIPDLRHRRLFFEDGNITFRVRLCLSWSLRLLTWSNLHRSRACSIASIVICSANRVISRIFLHGFPRSRRPRTLLLSH